VDANAAERLFRHKVIGFLRDEELLSQERIDLLLWWQNSGFSVHNAVTVAAQDAAGTERLARYLLLLSLSLERMSWDGDGSVLYRRKASSRFGSTVTAFAPMDFLARLLMHVRGGPGRSPGSTRCATTAPTRAWRGADGRRTKGGPSPAGLRLLNCPRLPSAADFDEPGPGRAGSDDPQDR